MLNRMSHLNQRLLVGIIVVSLLYLAIYFSSYPYFRPFFALIASSIIGCAVWEYYHMAKAKGLHPLEGIGVLGSIMYVISVFWTTQTTHALFLPSITLGAMAVLAFLYYFFREGDPFVDLAVTFFAVMYITIPLALLVNINYYFPSEALQDGRWWLAFLLIICKMTDTGAFFFGKAFGRAKLAPRISPKKTWEGAIGGLLTALACGALFFYFIRYFSPDNFHGLSLWTLLGLAAVLSIFSQFSDLSESILKRDAGVKDSNQLPGLGGLLDMVDSLIFTTPLVYGFLKLTYP